VSAPGALAPALGGGLADARATRCPSRGQAANRASRTGAPPRSLAMCLFERGAELPGLSSPQGLRMLGQGREELGQGREELGQGREELGQGREELGQGSEELCQ